MRSEISEIKRAVKVICANEMRMKRRPSLSAQNAPAEMRVNTSLTTATVDAVFEEEMVSFVGEGQDAKPQAARVESLAAQLAALESQCQNLRQLLALAPAQSHS